MGFSLAASEQAERTKGGNAPHSSKLPSEWLTSHYIKKNKKKKQLSLVYIVKIAGLHFSSTLQ